MQPFNIIVDDDPLIGKIVEKSTQIKSDCYFNVKDLLNANINAEPVCVFLDVHLGADENGLNFISKIKKKWPLAPIIVLTSDTSEDVLEKALQNGANDFIRKPISRVELNSRLHARRTDVEKDVNSVLKFSDLFIDLRRNIIRCKNKEVSTSFKNIEIIHLLNTHRGERLDREALKNKIWGNVAVTNNSIDKKLFEVRELLKDLESQVKIRTIYGGYVTIEYQDENVVKNVG